MRNGIGSFVLTAALALGSAAAVVAAPAPAPALAGESDGDVVVKLVNDDACRLEPLLTKYRIEVVSTVLASRRIYLVRRLDPLRQTSTHARELAKKIAGDACVAYAEGNLTVSLTDERYHAWPSGTSIPSSEEEWLSQAGVRALELPDARTLSTGSGVRVAVLDTGVDAEHPVLAGRVVAGWDYADDDGDPSDPRVGDVAGHGTFVAGIVHLIAPDAEIISMRVLGVDGTGDGYVVAEAIYDAVRMGARVVNLSLGTAQRLESKVLAEAIKWARKKGTLTTAAAGNDGGTAQHWPAAQPEAVSVAALDTDNATLAAFSTSGGWVDCAALGTDLISPVPDGGYDAWSGTSMATPVVSGQLALIAAAAPRLDAAKLEEKLKQTSRRVSGAKLRYGAVDIPASIRLALD